MNAIEQSLRRVLAKGDATDPDHRVRIYEASERAIDRLLSDGKINEAGRDAQHAQLIAAIESIEADYPADAPMPATPAPSASSAPDPVSAPSPAPSGAASPAASPEPQPPRSRATPLPAGATGGGTPADAARPPAKGGAADPGGQARASLERRTAAPSKVPPAGRASAGARKLGGAVPSNRLVYALVLVAVILFVAAAAYLVLPGLFGASEPANGSAGANAASLAPTADGWITVFSADRPELVTTPGGGSVEAVTGEGERAALRIAVPAAAGDGEVVFPVGPGVLSRLGGKAVQVEIDAGSPDGSPREFAVRCAIGEEAVCGRQRFSVAQASEPLLFAMDAPADAGASALIAINPGVGAPGQSVDIYAIRMRAG